MLLKIARILFNFIREIVETAFLVILVFLVLYLFLVRPHQIHGDSMLPSYHDGDYLLTEVVSYKFLKRELKRGDVVVFHSPQTTGRDFIKRIVALPGEKIKIQNGAIFIINDQYPQGFLLEESYLPDGTTTQPRRTISEGKFFEIGEGYVVMGDNRARSSDSRDWGVITKTMVVGRAWFRYWPPSALGFIQAQEYPD